MNVLNYHLIIEYLFPTGKYGKVQSGCSKTIDRPVDKLGLAFMDIEIPI